MNDLLKLSNHDRLFLPPPSRPFFLGVHDKSLIFFKWAFSGYRWRLRQLFLVIRTTIAIPTARGWSRMVAYAITLCDD